MEDSVYCLPAALSPFLDKTRREERTCHFPCTGTWRKTDGYAMVRTIRDQGHEVEENTLYPLLRRLEKNGWIRSKWNVREERPRKFYSITEEGRALRAELLAIWKNQDRVLSHFAGEKNHV